MCRELFPVTNRFCRGHRLRFEISSSHFPLFDVNPNSGESAGSWQHPCIANNRVFVDMGRQSHGPAIACRDAGRAAG
ncbi:MAG: hypothetical protein E6G72_10185 [Alphaproteobacteria bacterium]|nr:MAG: hypothetical protein E6G72_10185 [Alphaproteobacteria bacterium]